MTTTKTYERMWSPGTVELRAAGEKRVIAGYASVFNKLSQNLGGFVERVAPGAFAKTIQEQPVMALYNHDEGAVLGSRDAGTLRLEEDGTGLAYEIDPPETSLARDLAALLERGDVRGSSFGFRVIEDEWGETEQGFPLRTLMQVSLRDVGPVTFPAYTDSTSALRSLAEARSIDLSVVVAAADAGDLRSILQGDTDGRENPTVHRRPAHWFI